MPEPYKETAVSDSTCQEIVIQTMVSALKDARNIIKTQVSAPTYKECVVETTVNTHICIYIYIYIYVFALQPEEGKPWNVAGLAKPSFKWLYTNL